MVVVRSVRMVTFIGRRQGALELGQELFMRFTTSMTFAPGCLWILTYHRRGVVHPGRLLHVLRVVDDVRHVGKRHRRAVSIGDDQGPVVLARQELVVGPDNIGLPRAVEAALGLVDVRA